jgi:hypothetical protein
MPQLPQAVSYVLDECFNHGQRPLFSIDFLYLLDSTKTAQSGVARLVPRHSAADVLPDLHLQVGTQFFVEFLFEPSVSEQRDQTRDEHSQPGHLKLPRRLAISAR